jgi:hypothetical protein
MSGRLLIIVPMEPGNNRMFAPRSPLLRLVRLDEL